MKYTNRILRAAAGLLAVLALCGCVAEEPAPTTAPTEPTQTTPTQPSRPTVPTVPSSPLEPTPVPVPELEAVTCLTCVEFDVFPRLLNLGNGLVVASRNTYNDLQGLINETLIIDIYNDQVVAKSTRSHALELVCQQFRDGLILMSEADSGKFYLFDQSLTVTFSFTAPRLDGYFSYDRSSYYYVQDEVLYRLDTGTGESQPITTDKGLMFESLIGIHPDQNRLVARVYLSEHGTDYGLAVLDVPSGKVLLLRDDLTQVWLTGDDFYGVEPNRNNVGNDVFYGDLTQGSVMTVPASQLYAPSVSYDVLPGSHYLVRRLAPDSGDRSTWLYDMTSGTMADLSAWDFADAVFSSIYLADSGLIFGYYSQKEEKTPENPYPKETFHPVLIDPEALIFEATLTPNQASWQTRVDSFSETIAPLPNTLASLQTQAKALTDRFGVEILLGEQVLPICSHSQFTVTPCEDAAAIEAALNTLEAELSKYPAGFFAQLKNSAGKGGLKLCLTGSIKGSLNPAGFAQKCRSSYEVTLDISAQDLASTLHHELWHIIEMRLSTDRIDPAEWNALNPEGFAYYGSYDKGYKEQTKWTLAGSGEAHFVDSYGCISALEDRAQLMALVMTGGTLEQAPMLQAKLRLMAQAIRDGFDPAGWTEVLWEQP